MTRGMGLQTYYDVVSEAPVLPLKPHGMRKISKDWLCHKCCQYPKTFVDSLDIGVSDELKSGKSNCIQLCLIA